MTRSEEVFTFDFLTHNGITKFCHEKPTKNKNKNLNVEITSFRKYLKTKR